MLDTVQQSAKWVVKRYAPTVLYPRPVSALQPERLYAYMDAIWQRRDLDGAIVEVGAWLGGTAALVYRMLRNTGHEKRYVCVDTFAGFVPEQFAQDVGHGTSTQRSRDFAKNSRELVGRLMRHYGTEQVELVEGDIARVPDSALPDRVAVALVDVDLDVPVYEGLKRVQPRLVAGAIALVDDCGEGGDWQGARAGYKRFVDEHGLPERYFMGMGIVEG
jgi:O-methyltransferase